MKKIYMLLALGLLLSSSASANRFIDWQDSKNLMQAAIKGWHIRLGAGFNIGGTAPLPMPAEIRSIDGYNPGMNIAIEGSIQKNFDKSHWGMILGIRLENKGMKTDASTKNYHMEAVSADGGMVVGPWTGEVHTEVDNSYLTFPVLASYKLSDRWQLTAGPYFAWMIDGSFDGYAHNGYYRNIDPTGEKIELKGSATYDFSKDLRRFHWGVQAGGEFKAYKHLSVFANLQWGLNGIFPKDFTSVTFDLYPIYATFGFNYLF